jgi:CHAT domain-containing protein
MWDGADDYLAFVLRPDASVALISLGSSARVDEEVRRAREALNANLAAVLPGEIAETGRKASDALARLHALLWRPLEAKLGGAEQVYLSTDGELNVVPFAALPDAAGRPLLERYRIAILASGRDLLRRQPAAAANPSDLVLVADPAFDAPATVAAGAKPLLRPPLPKFDPLPGTAREAQEVPALLGGTAARKHVLLGAQATKAAIRALPRPRILHFATHGYFLEDLRSPAGPDLRAGASAAGAAPTQDNPLVRSGLALAGANRATGGDYSGVLTALEVLDLDLEGTELVVLSACETGLGDVRSGEGVFGLRRGFALAGARALLMSLWPVADEIAAEQMRDFYANLRSLPPAEALRRAQLASIKRLEAGGAAARPALWAPFILQGR